MWLEPLLEFLDRAEALYGVGRLAAGPLSLAPVNGSPSLSGAGETIGEAVEMINVLERQFELRCDGDASVGGVIARACDSIEYGRKVVSEESEAFRSSVGALGPVSNSPFGTLTLLPAALGVLGSVMSQIQGTSGDMTGLSEEFPGADPESEERAFLASNSLRSGPLAPVLGLLQSVDGLPYVWGGNSQALGYDCSGLVSAVANVSAGLPPDAGRASTANLGPFLASRGWRRGPGGPYSIEVDWYDGAQYAGGGHTAGTVHLGDRSINFESSGNGVQFGRAARGSRDVANGNVMHIPLYS